MDFKFDSPACGNLFSPFVCLSRSSPGSAIAMPPKQVHTRDVESRRRRKLAYTLAIDDWATSTAENPEANPQCPLWLVRVAKPAYRYDGSTKRQEGVYFVKGHHYIDVHVYKPQRKFRLPGGFGFKWDSGPGRGVSLWSVDAESITWGFKENPDAVAFAVDSAAACDVYHLRQIREVHFKAVMDNFFGRLADL